MNIIPECGSIEEYCKSLNDEIISTAKNVIENKERVRNVEWCDKECNEAALVKYEARKCLVKRVTRVTMEAYRQKKKECYKINRRKKREATNRKIDELKKSPTNIRKFYKNKENFKYFYAKNTDCIEHTGRILRECNEILDQ